MVVYEATVSTLTQRKLQNSPRSIYKYSFIAFRHATAKNDRNLSLFVYNMQLYIQRLKSAYYLASQ